MLDKKEKYVMSYVYNVCYEKKAHLIYSEEIIEYVSKKYVISLPELEQIMLSLNKDGYFDYVVSESKNGTTFCISLKNKGIVFLKDLEKERKHAIMTVAKSVGLAVMSFLIGVILRMIFS